MYPLVALDLTCLFLAPLSRTPRGIDRVELAYAKHFLSSWGGDCVATLPTPWGIRFFDRGRALRGVSVVESLWSETITADQDRVYGATKLRIAGEIADATAAAYRPVSFTEKSRGFFRIIQKAGFSFGSSCKGSLPANSIYLNVGQLSVFSIFLRWLRVRKDVNGVFMLHDVTPLELPSHHAPGVVRMHESVMDNVTDAAKALIFPSVASRDSVMLDVASRSGRALRGHVELLPVPDAFLKKDASELELAGHDFFVICGVIDSHKNHVVLLRAWEMVVKRLGAKAPKLVIVGYPGSTSAPALEYLSRSATIKPYVLIASGLSTAGLRRLIANAKAVLMPSLSEGFGLPIVEALAQGTPVVASDIPAHREAGHRAEVVYIDPVDENRWAEAILRMAAEPKTEVRGYVPKTWAEYFRGVEGFLLALSAEN